MQIGIALEALGPVIAHCFLAFEFSRRLSCDLGNERRRHLKVVGVVRENSIQVVAVPGSNPLGREVIGKSPVKHTFCSPVLGTFSYSCLDRSSKVVRLLAQAVQFLFWVPEIDSAISHFPSRKIRPL